MYSQYDESIKTKVDINACKILANSWPKRVAVKNNNLDSSTYYDISIPDYPIELVPFKEDERFISLDESVKKKILAAAWISYNEKTMDIEATVTGPACSSLLSGKFRGFDIADLKRLLVQTQVDENFHFMMCLDACLLTRKMHELEALKLPRSLVTLSLLDNLKNQNDDRKRDLLQIAYAAVAEVTVNAYLDLLADHQGIQPFNRETTRWHRVDETTHRDVYKNFVIAMYSYLDIDEKRFFHQALGMGLDAFVKIDYDAWLTILSHLGISDAEAIINSCIQRSKGRRILRDYRGFLELLSQLGVTPSEVDFCFSEDV
jgi:alpha-N-dichloroacetyl-p-aminophenylserinol N-oxygenase